MIKEGYEVIEILVLFNLWKDYQRFKQDKEVNLKKVKVFDYGTKNFSDKLWSQIVVGDLIKVCKDEQFPCDIIFAKCSSKNGIAFVDTMNLDGEVWTN